MLGALQPVTDGEQRRDNFYSFVAAKLEGVRLMSLNEMLDVVEDRAGFERLLQTLDEYHNGYQHSRYLLDLAGIVPRRRLPQVGMVLVDGQMVGGMTRELIGDRVRFTLGLYRDLDAAEQQAVVDAADRYGTFLARPASVRFGPA